MNKTIFSETDSKNAALKRQIINLCIESGSYSIAELSAKINASVPTVTKLLNELIDEGFLQDLGKQGTSGGRRPSIFGLNPEAGYFIGVDIARQHFHIAICDMMITNRICGIIVSQAKSTNKYDHFTKLQNENIPLVFCDRICTGIDASRVVVDDYHGAFTAVKHLIETGCGRIAFCGSSVKLEIMKNRLNGYRDALLQHNMEIDESLILECDNRGMSEQVIPQVLARDDRPDGFFAINDDTAVGVIHVAKQCGLRVPEDVSVCGFTNGERALACDPMLTTIDQRGPELGKQAADILISQVKGLLPMDKAHKRIVRTNLIVRGSTRINPTDRD